MARGGAGANELGDAIAELRGRFYGNGPTKRVANKINLVRVCGQGTVICEYIDDEWPTPPLKPVNTFGRAQMRLWTKQLDEGLHAAVGSLSFAIAFRHQWLARSSDERSKWLSGIPQQDPPLTGPRRQTLGLPRCANFGPSQCSKNAPIQSPQWRSSSMSRACEPQCTRTK